MFSDLTKLAVFYIVKQCLVLLLTFFKHFFVDDVINLSAEESSSILEASVNPVACFKTISITSSFFVGHFLF